MNPSIAQPAPPKMMPASAQPVKAELVQNIPVKAPANHGAQASNNPISAPIALASHDKALDVVLKNIAQEVKNPSQAAAKFAPPPKAKAVHSNTAVPIAMAIIVAAALSTTAYYSFGG